MAHYSNFFFNVYFYPFCPYAHMCTMCMQYLQNAEAGSRFSGTGVSEDYELEIKHATSGKAPNALNSEAPL